MTNANIDQVVTAVDGQRLTLKYKNGEKKIFAPADTPIVAYMRGDNTDLKPGAKVFVAAVKQPDGTLQGRAWRVGRDGGTPPMWSRRGALHGKFLRPAVGALPRSLGLRCSRHGAAMSGGTLVDNWGFAGKLR